MSSAPAPAAPRSAPCSIMSLIVSAVGVVVWLAAWPLALFGARHRARSASPARSRRARRSRSAPNPRSPACRPCCAPPSKLDVPVAASGVVLPMAVALFRATGPAMNLAVAIYVAYWFGIELTPMQMALGVAAARDHDDGRGRHSRPGELRHLDRADLHRHGRADRAARPADRGRDRCPTSCARSAMSAWTSPPPRPSRSAIGLRRGRGGQPTRTGCWRKAHEISHARPGPRSLRARHRLHADGPRRQHHLRRDASDDESIATIHRAIDLGITFFDTAEMYGPFAERGAARRGDQGQARRPRHRHQVRAALERQPAGRASTAARTMRAAPAKARCKRLGIDTIDLFYQHRVDPNVPIEETIGGMAELVKEGKVRHIGLSEAAPETIRRAAAVHPIAALQSEYSLWERDVEDDILPVCRELGIGFVPYSPLGRGFLTGQIRSRDRPSRRRLAPQRPALFGGEFRRQPEDRRRDPRGRRPPRRQPRPDRLGLAARPGRRHRPDPRRQAPRDARGQRRRGRRRAERAGPRRPRSRRAVAARARRARVRRARHADGTATCLPREREASSG